MSDNPAASPKPQKLRGLNSPCAVAQVHAPDTLGPVYAGKSFLNLFVHLKSVQPSTGHLHTCAEDAVCLRVRFPPSDVMSSV